MYFWRLLNPLKLLITFPRTLDNQSGSSPLSFADGTNVRSPQSQVATRSTAQRKEGLASCIGTRAPAAGVGFHSPYLMQRVPSARHNSPRNIRLGADGSEARVRRSHLISAGQMGGQGRALPQLGMGEAGTPMVYALIPLLHQRIENSGGRECLAQAFPGIKAVYVRGRFRR